MKKLFLSLLIVGLISNQATEAVDLNVVPIYRRLNTKIKDMYNNPQSYKRHFVIGSAMALAAGVALYYYLTQDPDALVVNDIIGENTLSSNIEILKNIFNPTCPLVDIQGLNTACDISEKPLEIEAVNDFINRMIEKSSLKTNVSCHWDLDKKGICSYIMNGERVIEHYYDLMQYANRREALIPGLGLEEFIENFKSNLLRKGRSIYVALFLFHAIERAY